MPPLTPRHPACHTPAHDRTDAGIRLRRRALPGRQRPGKPAPARPFFLRGGHASWHAKPEDRLSARSRRCEGRARRYPRKSRPSLAERNRRSLSTDTRKPRAPHIRKSQSSTPGGSARETASSVLWPDLRIRGSVMAKRDLTQLGRNVALPQSPDKAILDAVPNPHIGEDYVVRFTAPEFTSLCPITGQPDFAHFVIDYVPAKSIVESKSLKLFLGSFRNHGAFH